MELSEPAESLATGRNLTGEWEGFEQALRTARAEFMLERLRAFREEFGAKEIP